MPRALRIDFTGVWLHIWNRALGQRNAFETDQDMRRFLLRLALEVRAGLIEIHAYAILANHFHLLVRSVKGQISRAMQRIQQPRLTWLRPQLSSKTSISTGGWERTC